MAVGSVYPNDWVTVCTAPDALDVAIVIQPGAITRAEQFIAWFDRRMRFFYVRLMYDVGITAVTTSPVIAPWGVTSQLSEWTKLYSQNDSHTITLTPDLVNDQKSTDGFFKYTDHRNTQIILDNLSNGVLCPIEVVFAGTGGPVTNSEIQLLAVY